jgi:hypothetical protein
MHDAAASPTTNDDGDRERAWRRPDAAFFRGLLALPELALVAESCDAERRLHDKLLHDALAPVGADELAAVADADARDNLATLLAFRADVVAAGSLEAHYLAVVRSGRVALPPAFLDAMVAAIVAPLLEDSATLIERRAGQLLHRAQRIAIVDGRVLAADRERAELAGEASRELDLVRDFARGGAPASQMAILGASSAADLPPGTDPGAFALDLTHEIASDVGHGLNFTLARADSGLSALARVLERWIGHFLAVRTTIRPVPRIDDDKWRWHVGLDVESSAILNALYRGEQPDAGRLERLVGLFRLDFADPREMRADVAGKPVYLGLACTAERTLKLKPQNLLVNLPLATPV